MESWIMLNTLPVKAANRIPKGLVFINGELMAWTDFRVTTTTFYQADTFDINLPLNGQKPGFGKDYFSSTPAMLIEIYAGFPSNPKNFSKSDLYNLITAQVDDVEVSEDQTSVNLIGRDLTAKFIDSKTTEKFENMPASQIATLLAQRAGLTPVVTPTTVKAGYFYGIDHARMTNEQSEWDLLTYLAQESNFVVYVQGQSLFFKAAPTPSDNPYVIQETVPGNTGYPNINAVKVKYGRNLTLARDVIVKVRSWNAQYPRGFIRTAKATPNKRTVIPSKAQPIGDAQTYVRVIPNLTPEQALQRAQQILAQISQHERRIHVEMPGDNLLNKDSIIKLQGSNSDWDQIYFPSEIVRTMSLSEGYRMEVAAKNHSPNSETIV
jgi:phage protein D